MPIENMRPAGSEWHPTVYLLMSLRLDQLNGMALIVRNEKM